MRRALPVQDTFRPAMRVGMSALDCALQSTRIASKVDTQESGQEYKTLAYYDVRSGNGLLDKRPLFI